MTKVNHPSFNIIETTIEDIHSAMQNNQITARSLTDQYIDRIAAIDSELQAIITVNPSAQERAEQLDSAFSNDGFTGPLHGIPVIVKDNHDTHDMKTTAGSTALAQSNPPASDAFIIRQLRAAGGIILAKANLQELSFGVDTISGVCGATRNPYDTERRPAGSSGGTAAAIAANLGVVGTGSDTCSSIRSPASFNNLVGIRPTNGLISRSGIVPLSSTQDTVGPLTRSVEDAARLLDVIVGYDPTDPETARGVSEVPEQGYIAHLDEDGLDGARIGIARQFFGIQETDTVSNSEAETVSAVLEEGIESMRDAGASIIDPIDQLDVTEIQNTRVVRFEFARDLNRYLATRDIDNSVNSLQKLVESRTMAPAITQRIKESAILEVDPATVNKNVTYLRRLVSRTHIGHEILGQMIDHDIDALLYPPSTIPPVIIPEHQPFAEMNCELAAHTGFPAIVVPAGYTPTGLPIGLELLGRPFGEPRLIELAYAFEQLTDIRQPPGTFS